jgi:hypothetical protein
MTHDVLLTVTDNGGATGTVTHTVSPTSPVGGTLATDTFNRTVTGGFGTADTGGPWTVSPRPGSRSAALQLAGHRR